MFLKSVTSIKRGAMTCLVFVFDFFSYIAVYGYFFWDAVNSIFQLVEMLQLISFCYLLVEYEESRGLFLCWHVAAKESGTELVNLLRLYLFVNVHLVVKEVT
ncbi:hypothetical protein L1987_16882 [Smallanthus sonchifolius]|uniref:Uncharacterized protein n=1 Tax=Smallanthus sonchifolius TaxID=185202 RepID=A0ACB9IVY3_9ASTR|nr:hypothetical protein L1987_16882 [Smallanthus sonchifolius]